MNAQYLEMKAIMKAQYLETLDRVTQSAQSFENELTDLYHKSNEAETGLLLLDLIANITSIRRCLEKIEKLSKP